MYNDNNIISLNEQLLSNTFSSSLHLHPPPSNPNPISPLINLSKLQTQKHLTINSIPIYFPYEPYPSQITYMEKTIQSLTTQTYSLLESPTGTGKTLCLLCASLSWLLHKKQTSNTSYKIFYSSRTHVQITNVINELKKTCFTPKIAILSSRDVSCVNPVIKHPKHKGQKLVFKCKELCDNKKCFYFFNVSHSLNEPFGIMDIEDICKEGAVKKFCPYYHQKEYITSADIIFLPYNCMINKEHRNSFQIDLQNAILIFDEAHNLPFVCEEDESLLIDEEQINTLINAVQQCDTNAIINANKSDIVLYFINILGEMKRMQFNEGKNRYIRGRKLNVLELIGLFIPRNDNDNANANAYDISILSKCYESLNNLVMMDMNTKVVGSVSSVLTFLYFILDLYKQYIVSKNTEIVNSFSFYIYNDNEYEDQNGASASASASMSYSSYSHSSSSLSMMQRDKRTIRIMCLNPGYNFKKLVDSKPYTIILTSGTLIPFESIESELKCEFPIKLENKHIINNSQILFSVVNASYFENNKYTQSKFIFDYNTREDKKLLYSLGYSIYKLSTIVNDGILVFFPSYSYMSVCYKYFKAKGLLSQIEQHKKVLLEVKDRQGNLNSIKLFNNNNNSKSKRRVSTILFSVFRGSFAEGINFSGDSLRVVVLVSIPFANVRDIKVAIKQEYLNTPVNQQLSKITGSDWYKHEALRQVNQSIGRLIRHKNDYGVILLFDERYQKQHNKALITKWLRDSLTSKVMNDEFIEEIKSFFKTMTKEQGEEGKDSKSEFIFNDNSSHSEYSNQSESELEHYHSLLHEMNKHLHK